MRNGLHTEISIDRLIGWFVGWLMSIKRSEEERKEEIPFGKLEQTWIILTHTTLMGQRILLVDVCTNFEQIDVTSGTADGGNSYYHSTLH